MLPPQKITIQPTAFPEEPSGTHAREGPPPAPAGDSGPGGGSLWHAVLDINKSRSDMCLESCPFLPKALGRGGGGAVRTWVGQGASGGGPWGAVSGRRGPWVLPAGSVLDPRPQTCPSAPILWRDLPKLLAGGVDPRQQLQAQAGPGLHSHVSPGRSSPVPASSPPRVPSSFSQRSSTSLDGRCLPVPMIPESGKEKRPVHA